MAAVQFFQTVLAGNVYNEFFGKYVFSPGSALIFTSTLYCILLIYITENAIKVRAATYGILFSNIVITLFSYISLEQIYVDDYTKNRLFLEEIFNFDIKMFISGTALLMVDCFFIILLFQKFKKLGFSLYLNFLMANSLVSVLDSYLFYTINFFSNENYLDLVTGNIVGKLFSCFLLSLMFGIYFNIIELKVKTKKGPMEIFFGKKQIDTD